MTNVRPFLEHLGIKIVREEGDGQLLCRCPWCGGKKLYVNKDSCLWDCKRGCGSGNAYQLAEKLTTLDSKGIMALLDEYGLSKADRLPDAKRAKSPADEIGTPRIKPSEACVMTHDEVLAFCKVKGLDPHVFETIMGTPYRYRDKPIALLPAYHPYNLHRATAILRAHLEGNLIKLANGKEEKYPLVSGSKHGLFGLRRVLQDKPDEIIFTEGWRDCVAATAAGFYALASSGGTSCFKDGWLPAFDGKKVYICMDADEPGQKAADRAARKIWPVAKEVRIFNLPYPVKKDHGKDLYDFLSESLDTGNADPSQVDWSRAWDTCQKVKDEGMPYEPPPDSPKDIILPNDDPDTVAAAFAKNTQQIYHNHADDGWSEYGKEGRYAQIALDDLRVKVRQLIASPSIKVKRRKRNEDGKYENFCAKPDKKMKSIRYINETIAWLDMPPVRLRSEQKAPCSLDGKLDPANIIAANNCLLDISTYPPKQHPLSPDFYTLNYLDVDYDPSANCPRWEKFLIEIFFEKILSADRTELDENGEWVEGYEIRPDSIAIQLLQEYIGLCLTHETKYQKILGIIGPKRSGKGTIGRILRKLAGGKNVTAPTLASLTTEFGMYGLIGKTVAIIGDASLGGRNQNVLTAVERLKSISGEDAISIRRMRTTPLEVEKLPLRFVIMGNELQSLTDPTGALASRWLYLFTKKSFYGREDLDLEAKLTAELPGILNWSIGGLHRLMQRGHFIEPPDSVRARRTSEEIGSAVIAFGRECCAFGRDYHVRKTDLWTVYRKWAEEAGRGKMGKNKFYGNFEAAFPDCPCVRNRIGGFDTNAVWVFSGVGLRPEWQVLETEK